MNHDDILILNNFVRKFQVARKETQNYAPSHPVSVKASEALMELLASWFLSHDELALVCENRHFSVMGVPLTQLGDPGVQLGATFEDLGLGSLIFLREVAREQLQILLKVMVEKSDPDMASWITKAVTSGGGGIRALPPGHVEKPKSAPTNIGRLYDTSITVVRNILEGIREGSEMDVQQVRSLSKQMVSSILDEPKKLFLVTTSHPDFREDLFAHSLDVAIVSTSLAATLIRERAWLEEVMFCGIVHDVGKSLIPKEILYKPGKLDAAEWEIMMKHAEMGGHILYGVPGVGDLAPQVAYEHQAKFDLSGYPKLKFKKKLHPVTQLVIIADTYSALTAVRAYKKPFSPGRSLSIMEEMSGTAFQPSLFNQFVVMSNFYAAGNRARLAGGELVEVIKVFPSSAMRPLVRVVEGAEGSELHPGDMLDLGERDPYSRRYKWSLADRVDDLENAYGAPA